MRTALNILIITFVLAFSEASAAGTLQLDKGVNLSNWLANAERQPLYERDFRQIQEAGFDNIRLPVKPDLLSGDFTEVDNAVRLAFAYHLNVVLDLHPSEAYKQQMENAPAHEQALIDLWVRTARYYQNVPDDQLVFELLNEPQYYGHEEQYNQLAAKLVAAIRQVDKDRVLIIGAPRGSSLEGLLKLQPLNDENILYAFHFYEPLIVTHEGIHRGFDKLMLRYFHDVPYPASRVNHDAAFYADAAPNPMQAQAELDAYVTANWNREHIAERLLIAKNWADIHKVRIICGEFGVLRNHIDAASRYRWIRDVREVLEDEHIGWQLRDYTDLDGITQLEGETRTDKIDGSVHLANPEKGTRIIEKDAIKALGLD